MSAVERERERERVRAREQGASTGYPRTAKTTDY